MGGPSAWRLVGLGAYLSYQRTQFYGGGSHTGDPGADFLFPRPEYEVETNNLAKKACDLRPD